MSVCIGESRGECVCTGKPGECVRRGEQIMFGHCKESNGRRPIFSSNGAAQRLYTHWTLFIQPLPCIYCTYCMLLRQSSI